MTHLLQAPGNNKYEVIKQCRANAEAKDYYWRDCIRNSFFNKCNYRISPIFSSLKYKVIL